MKHSWKRCRLNGCEECCSCSDNCDCSTNWATVQDLIDSLKLLNPEQRLAFRHQYSGLLEDDFCFSFGLHGYLPVKYNEFEVTFRESDGNGGNKAPNGYEDCVVIEIFNEYPVTFKSGEL